MTSLPPPMASRLVRTVSMHHIKGCKYVPLNGSFDNQKTTNDRSGSYCLRAPTSSTFVQNEPRKTCQQCGSVSGLSLTDQIHQSKDLLDFLQFFNENKNLLMNIARNPQFLLAKEPLEKQVSSVEGIGLNKSQTFPRPGMPKNIELQVPSSALSNSKAIRSDIKKAIRDNKKEVMHIANDGFLHKVPYGRKDNERHKRNYQKEGGETQLRRSASLVDSLDKYSNLFESISKDVTKLREATTSLPEKASYLAFKRIHSSPEIKNYSVLVPPPVATSSRDTPDMKIACVFSEAKTLDNVLNTDEVEPVGMPPCTDEEADLLDPQLNTNQAENVDPDLDNHEGMPPSIKEKRIFGSPFSDEYMIGDIYLKQSLSGDALK
jgi:Protein of unknown function (DUF3741)